MNEGILTTSAYEPHTCMPNTFQLLHNTSLPERHCEEIYWRGALQGYMRRKFSKTKWAPWVISTAYYSLVHLSTLNPILVLAAFFVGLTASLIAEKHGILASAAVHIIWIEAIIIFLPVIAIH